MTYTNNQRVCLLLRLFLGVMFLTASLMKLQKGALETSHWIISSFKDTLLPHALLAPYAYALPYVELVLGVTLILGIFTDVMLMVAGVFLITLFFGKWMMGDLATAAYNAIYFLIAVCAIRWFEHVAPSVDVVTRKKKIRTPVL